MAFDKKAYNRKYTRQWLINNPNYRRNYYLNNIEKEKERDRQYRLNNKEKVTERHIKYNESHKQERAIYQKKWYQENKIKKDFQNKQWRKEHPENDKEYTKKYRGTLNYKISNKKSHFKRRQLGFIPLNKYFEGSEAHHISENFVIYISKKLHQSFYHNIWTWRSMEKMNKLAIEYL